MVLPISEKHVDYAKKVLNYLNNSDIRTLIDDRDEKVGKKIRDNELKKIPYLLIVGEKESMDGTVSVRKQGEGDQGAQSLKEFVKKIHTEVAEQTNFHIK